MEMRTGIAVVYIHIRGGHDTRQQQHGYVDDMRASCDVAR